MSTAQTPAQALEYPELVIAPPSRWSGLRLHELWAHRELIYFLTKRELQLRYKQSVFGIGWAVFQPLVLAFVLAFFFGFVLKTQIPGDLPYPVFAVAGIVPWTFTSQAINQGAGSLVLDADLISKVYFPRLALPISKALGLVLDLVIAMVVVVFVTLVYGVSISSMFWLVPAFLALGVITAFAIATLLAAINVKYRDVQVLVPVIVQILFFASPVIYSGAIVGQSSGEFLSYLYYVNPMATVLDGTRWALLAQPAPSLAKVLISVCSATVLLTAAILYFRRAEQFFADVI
jgi:lipopolysaccharide transport system permease protein